MHTALRTARRIVLVASALLLALGAIALSGCSGSGQKYSADDLTAAWKAHPESKKWDMEVRDVITQTKSTGDHDASYTVFLTTFTNKAVPDFKMYGTVDVPPDDSMTFEERTKSFFDMITYKSSFSGVQDTDAFMRFFAKEYPKEYFIRLIQEVDASGKTQWKVASLKKPPTASTLGDVPESGIVLLYDSQTKKWSEK